tara:strand:+ start:604 stop:795 length:192 start_codon:yes stop_codon:yes gene_type:complete
MKNLDEATQEYYALMSTGMGLPAIVKALNIPPMFVSRNYSCGGIYTEPYVIEQIDKLLSGLTD